MWGEGGGGDNTLAANSRVGPVDFEDAADVCDHYWECRHAQRRYFGGRLGNHDWHGQWRVISALAARRVVAFHAGAHRHTTARHAAACRDGVPGEVPLQSCRREPGQGPAAEP